MRKEMNSVKVWDLFVRFFHWTLVGTIVGLYLSGEEFERVHVRLGYFVAFLVLSRIVWGFVGTKHARFRDFLYSPRTSYNYLIGLIKGNPKHYIGHNPAGGVMIIVMLIALLVTVFTGLKALGTEGRGPLANSDISIFRVAYADEDEHDDDIKYRDDHRQKGKKEKLWEDTHELMTSFMIFLVSVHVGGVIVSSWIHRENLIVGMITGMKRKQ